MKKEEFQFLSCDKKNNIHAVKWMPDDGEIRAVFQITHGMIEYIERYEEFAEFLTEHGFLVVGHDHLGHGHSVSTKEDWGYISEKNGSDLLVADMHRLRKIVQKEYNGKPYFMLGHSMGSYMLRKYLTLHGKNLTGAIIMGTGMVSGGVTKSALALSRSIAKIHGWHYRSEFVKNLTFSGPYKKFCLDGSIPENSWLTKDIKIVNHYYSEPRCSFVFTLAAYKCLFETVYYDGQLENAKKIPKKLPLYLVSGADDPVGDLGKGVKKVYAQLKSAGIRDVSCKLYKNDRHEILNETDRENVYQDILAWCLARI